jgi:hypothetical protein
MAKRSQAAISDEQFDREYALARKQDDAYRRAGLYATGVKFDERARRFVLELTNGYSLGIPIAALPEIAGATIAQLREIALPTDDCLEIESLDVQFSVPGLVMAMSARAIGRLGGRAVSPSKKRASRANGKKGGRPRKATGA